MSWYRFRLLNGRNGRQLRLEMQSGRGARRDAMYQIGTEGGHVAEPICLPRFAMAPGERYEVVI